MLVKEYHMRKSKTPQSIGRNSKRKGRVYEKESADFWAKELKSDVRRTPRSGGFVGLKTDLMDLGNSVIAQRHIHIEVKGGNYAKISKKFSDMLDKSQDDADGYMNWLELHQKFAEPVILIKRRHLGVILTELNGFINQ